MCGIAGIVSRGGVVTRELAAMTQTIRHRGPDDEGYLLWAEAAPLSVFGGRDTAADLGLRALEAAECGLWQAGLGHRRLSIIDTSALGHQPMSNEDGTLWIVFNGEIYNHLELRSELIALGHKFQSRTDTEVILHAYEQWGVECLHRFNGMWAFLLLDVGKRRMFAARDRFGIKPLHYYVMRDGSLAFGSEIKQFTVLSGWRAAADRERVNLFLAYGLSQHGDQSFFSGVRSLKGGQRLICDLATLGIEIENWYDLSSRLQSISLRGKDAEDKFLDLFTDSVKLQLRSDVKLGSCLSGGLDSSAIVCTASKLIKETGSPEVMETVSSCFDNLLYDERKYIDLVSGCTGAKSWKVFPSYECLKDSFDELIWHLEEPFGTSSIFAQWEVFRKAKKEGIKVMLDGQGADELLAGYHEFYPLFWKGLLRNLCLGKLCSELRCYAKMHKPGCVKLAAGLARIALPGLLWDKIRELSGHSSPAWLSQRGKGEREELFGSSVLDASLNLLCSTRVPALLHFEDRNSMAHSVESRVPFLDHRLVEFAAGLPAEMKICNAETKYIMRRALSGVIPSGIAGRFDKMGFITPEAEWLSKDRINVAADLSEAAGQLGGLVDGKAMKLQFELDSENGRIHFGSPYWRLLCTAKWIKRFNVTIQE